MQMLKSISVWSWLESSLMLLSQQRYIVLQCVQLQCGAHNKFAKNFLRKSQAFFKSCRISINLLGLPTNRVVYGSKNNETSWRILKWPYRPVVKQFYAFNPNCYLVHNVVHIPLAKLWMWIKLQISEGIKLSVMPID